MQGVYLHKAARDVDTKEILTIRVSFTRSSLDAELFLKDVLQYCENKPLIIVDKSLVQRCIKF